MIKPLFENVLLKKVEVENKTTSGIILSTETKANPSIAQVVAVGPKCEAGLKADDKVVYKEYSGTKVKVDDVEYILLEEEDVLAIVE